MNKKEIDKLFVEKLPMLNKIVKGVSYKYNRYLNSDLVINEAYIHLIKNIDLIENEDQMQKLVINFINKNIIWTNSKINKQNKVNNIDEFYTPIAVEDEIDIHLQNKIEIEKWFNEKQSILFLYRLQEKNKIKQIVYDCFFIKNIKTGLKLAKHLGINKDYASKYIRQMKSDIKTYYDNYQPNLY